ncbi:MAG TPA: molecular chaperone DnaK, partial [Candidatus Binatia bacterium]|nr:molecular chaperone DnaK [Candidatus Binatia bacterium]
KKALESPDTAQIRSAADALARASHKLAEAMYAKASSQSGGGAGTGGASPGADADHGDGKAKDKEDVVEAEFEEVKE